jgi:hypothetical protein
VRGWSLLILLLLHGCDFVTISDPDAWPSDFVQKDTLPDLVGKHEDEVLEKLGPPKYIVKRKYALSYLYEDLDADTAMSILPIPFIFDAAHEVRCVLLNFNRDGVLQEYEIESAGASGGGIPELRVYNCKELFSLGGLIDIDLYSRMGVSPIAEEQYRQYLVRSPNNPSRLFYLCRAADQGHPNAQEEVGNRFAQGIDGVRQDLRRAYVWYLRAATKFKPDYTSPSHRRRVMSLESIRREMTSEQVVEAEILLADWKPGQCEREFTRKISGEAETTIRLTDKAGDTQSLAYIATREKEVSETDLTRLGEEGDAKAMLHKFWSVKGPERLKWLCRAASQGYAEAQYRVAFLYHHGKTGVPQDNLRAYMWYRLAAKNGHIWGDSDADKLATSMTPAELHSAIILMTHWEPGQCKRELVSENSGN